jgi:2-C-methyl-D-erythritol 4-phosphate cytidylyltransferase
MMYKMNIAIIVAGGSGLRAGGYPPKQFRKIYDKPLIIYCMEAFERHSGIDGIISVCRKEHVAVLFKYAQEFGISKLQGVVEAGETRRESVRYGLNAVKRLFVNADRDADNINVLIHDAVRPLVSERIISDNIAAVKSCGAAVTAIPAVDTMFISRDGVSAGQALARDTIYSAQTPQSFRLGIILPAHLSHDASGGADITDDCQLVLAAGHNVALVGGDERNFKVPAREDFSRLRTALDE